MIEGTNPQTTVNGRPHKAHINNPLNQPALVERLDEQVRQFFRDNNLEGIVEEEVLVRSARLAREPDGSFDHVPGLLPTEKRALRDEQNRNLLFQIRHLTGSFILTFITCCLAAIVQGWNQSNLNGANLTWPYDCNIDLNLDLGNPNSSKGDTWIFGGVQSISFFSAAAIGCWLSDPLNEYVAGRRGALFIAALFSFAGCLGAAYTETWQGLFVTRIITGIGMGAKASVTPIFIAEISPTSARGTLLTSWQALDAFGIMLGFAANLVVHKSWHNQMGAALIPAALLLPLVLCSAESPRWLLKRNRIPDAYRAMRRLRGEPILACRDLLLMHAQLQAETRYFKTSKSVKGDEIDLSHPELHVFRSSYQKEVEKTKPWSRFSRLFHGRRMWNANICAALVMLNQIFCGVNIIFFMGTSIFSGLGGAKLADESTAPPLVQRSDNHTCAPNPHEPTEAAKMQALWMSFGIGMANFLFVSLSWGTIDNPKRGRRFLLNWSFPLMALFLLLAGVAGYKSSHNGDTRPAVVITFLYLFVLAYSFGAGPIAFTLAAEVFPLVNREVGMSFAVFWNMLGNGILALVIPQLAYAMSTRGLLCLFAGLNLLLWVANYFVVRETADFSLEQLNEILEIPMRKQVGFQVARMRWRWGRYVRGREAEKPEILYEWAGEGVE